MRESIFAVPTNLHAEYQQLLSKTAHLLLQDGQTDELCQTVFDILRGPMKLDVYFHYLVSEDQSHLELASSGGNDVVRAALGSPLNFGEAVCGTVAQQCKWMYVPDVQLRDDPMTALIRSFGIRCYACQPLISKGKVLGTFSFGSSHRDGFTPEEIEVFRVVAQQVTVATERRVQNRYMRQLEHEAAAGRMCATIAHEINNPLESLTNILYLLRNEQLSNDGSHLLQAAEAEVARLAETTQRTLDLFRGKRQGPQDIDISKVMRDVLIGIRTPKHIPVESQLEDNLIVSANPGEMRQVFFNLVINAAHFSPSDKKVSVSASRNGASAEIQVKDQGPGISEETRRRLFQPFYTTRVDGGTGLGLWVSHEIVSRSGGTLTFESDPAKRPGTSFIVTLPLLEDHVRAS